MAKGLSYSPNEALIKGAAAIGLSKLPADQTALGKIAELGAGILKEEGERRQKAEDAIDNTIAQVLVDDGTLSDQHFALATKQAQEYKQSYMQGVYMNNDEGNVLKQKALNNLQKLANSSVEETQLRKNLAKLKEDNLLSDNLDITTFNAYLEHDYILKYEDGKKIYEINGIDYTYDDIKLFAKDLKNIKLENTFFNETQNIVKYIKLDKETNKKTFNKDGFEYVVLQDIADTKRGFANQMKDNKFYGNDIKSLLMKDSTLTIEVLNKIANADDNDDITIQNVLDLYKDPNTKDLIIDAILNTNNDAFDLENSRNIIANRLTNAAEKMAVEDNLFYVKPEDDGGDDDDDLFAGYLYVPDVREGDTGKEIQVSGEERKKMQQNINNKVRNFQGKNGYYVRLSGTKDGKQMYFRFDTKSQYDQVIDEENKDGKYYGGKIPSKKQNFDKLFPGAKGGYGYNRYIDEARLIELEIGLEIKKLLDK
tara:strand:+ start:920 stop:2362 length:1443 start_codon:yes stop_codon:yes gene_type:complete